MERCAYCGERVNEDALYHDDEVFCSEECMRDFGAGSYDEGGGDYDDDDEDEDKDEDEEEKVDLEEEEE